MFELLKWQEDLPDTKEVGNPPNCFTLGEWKQFWAAVKYEKRTAKPKWDRVLELACNACQAWYQREQLSQGNCQPIHWSDTPLWQSEEEIDE